MSITDPQLICTHPFSWFEIHQHGDVFLCCPAWLKRPIGNLLQTPVADIWNSPVAQEIRKTIHNRSFHNCSKLRCPFLADSLSPVQPLVAVTEQRIKRALETRAAHLDFPPTRLNLCFDHSCNLACPSCRSARQVATGSARDKAQRISEIICAELLPQAEEVTMSGYGDPFASPAYLAILQQLNTSSGEIPRLRLHSNGQLWTRQRWEQLPRLHDRVKEAEISIDAASAATYAVNRPGGSYEQLLDNLAYLAEQPFPLTLSMVVQQNNFREIPLLVELATRFKARVYLSRLVNWGTFAKAEFTRRAVHLPTHPEHQQLVSLLREYRHRPQLNLGNLLPLL